jgi:hypothetical protein
MQSALDPRILAPALGGVPVLQLALVDRSPLPVLEHLAADLRFAGVAVVDITPRIVFDATGLRDEAARDVMDESAALRRSPGEWIDARLGLGVEALLVLRRPDFSIRSIVDSWLPGRELELPLVTTRIDRFREIEFDRIDLDGRRVAQAVIVARNSRPPDEEGMAAIVRRTRTAARTIEGRGGRVVLVMLPVSDPAREVEERSFPRALYWDVLVEETGLPAIHFADHPALAEIECPDGLHMDRRVSREFSARFAPVLEAALDGAPAW